MCDRHKRVGEYAEPQRHSATARTERSPERKPTHNSRDNSYKDYHRTDDRYGSSSSHGSSGRSGQGNTRYGRGGYHSSR